MATTLEELEIKFSAQFGGLKTQLNDIKQQMGSVERVANRTAGAFSSLGRMAKTFLKIYVAREIFKIGKSSLQMANEVVESENLFAESMQGMSQRAREWSDGLRDSLGLNAYSLRKNIGTMNVMLKSMGIGSEKSYEMAESLTMLAEDMASFYNISSDDMFGKLQSGITGMAIPLKQLGILVDDTTAKEYAIKEGISASGKEMTQQQKVMARYAAIMDQTSSAQGDLARTINSPVNQIRVLNNTLNQAQIALGQAFQPIQAAVLPILNALASAALAAANAINTFMRALTGFTGKNIVASAAAEKSSKAQEGLKESLDDTSKALKGAGGAAKKAAKDANVGLKAFDEINKIADEAAKSSGGGGGGGGLDQTNQISQNERLAESLEAVNQAMSKAANWLKRVWELALPTREALARLWESLKNLGNVTISGIVDFYEKFLKPIGAWAVTKALPAFLDSLSSAIDLVSTVIEAAKPAWDKFYNDILVPIGNWAGEKVVSALSWLKNALDSITSWIKDNPETFSKIVNGIISIGSAIFTVWVVSSLISAVKNAFDILHGAIALFTSPKGAITLLIAALVWCAMNWDTVKQWAVDAWDGIQKAWNSAAEWFDENIVQPIRMGFSDAWGAIVRLVRLAWDGIVSAWNAAKTWFATNVTDPISRLFSDAWGAILVFVRTTWDEIVSYWAGAKEWFNTSIIDPIRRLFSDAWGTILSFVRLAWDGIVNAWENASTWFDENVVDPIRVLFTTAWDTISTKIGDVLGGIKEAWGSLSSWFDDNIIQPITGAWNSLMELLGVKKTVNVEYNVETRFTNRGGNEYGGKGGKLNTVPMFATGGVFQPNKPFLGILGDQKFGRNIEAPEGVLRDIFRNELKAVTDNSVSPRNIQYANANDANGIGNIVKQAVDSSIDRIKVSLNIDGQEFGRMSIRHINNASRIAGQPLLEF